MQLMKDYDTHVFKIVLLLSQYISLLILRRLKKEINSYVGPSIGFASVGKIGFNVCYELT